MGKMLAITLACSVAGQCFAYEDTAFVMGLTYVGKTQGEPGILDIDRDGDLDIIVPAHNAGPWPVMRNDGDHYTKVAELPLRDRHGCVSTDINGDGWADAYCVVGRCEGARECPGKSNEVWINHAGTLVDETRRWGAAGKGDRGRDAAFFGEYLAVANERSDYGSRNRLYRNTGKRFEPVGIPTGSAMTVAAGDVTGDGQAEVLFGAMALEYRRGAWRKLDVPWAGAQMLRDIEVTAAGVVTVEPKRVSLWPIGARVPSRSYITANATDVAVLADGTLYVVEMSAPDILLDTDWHPVESVPQDQGAVGDVVTAVPGGAIVTNGKWKYGAGAVQLIASGSVTE